MGNLSTSERTVLQLLRDGLYNIDATRQHGKVTMEFKVSEKRITEITLISTPTMGPEIASTEDTVERRLRR